MQICCKLIAFGLAAIAQSAARGGVPTEWQVRIGPKATVYQAERYHGDALELRATLTSGGLPLVYQGAARLYAQTNGMGARWWDLAPVTVASNVLAATWRPEFDTGADVVDLFLGAPSNFQAHARIRFLPSPGAEPNALPLPVPVIDFAAVEVYNIYALTNGWSFGDSGGPYLAATGGVVSGTVTVEGRVGTSAASGYAELGRDGVKVRRAGFPNSSIFKLNWPSGGNGTFARLEDIPASPDLTDATNYTDKVAADMLVGATNAAVAVADAKINTNNSAFVSAVLAAPLVGASQNDLAELSEYGSYGTLGAAILALIAGLAALKRRMTSAETAINGKANAANLPYAMVTPGEWTFSGGSAGQGYYIIISSAGQGGYNYDLYLAADGTFITEENKPTDDVLSVFFEAAEMTATRPSLPGQLLDRANNLVDVTTGDVTLTIPAFVEGNVRDLLVHVNLGADANNNNTPYTVTVNFPTGESGTGFKVKGSASAPIPAPDAAGEWLYSFSECAPHQMAVSLAQLQDATTGGS